MFDTSIVRSRAAVAPGRYGLLTASVVLHSAIIVAAIGASVASTRFPTDAPDQLTLFRPVEIPVMPPPIGRPDAPKRAPEQPKQLVIPQSQTAPAAIPDETPVLQPGAADPGPIAQPGTGEAPYGSPVGVDGGVGEVEPPARQEVPLTPGGEVRPARVIRRVDPQYPTSMIAARLKDVTVTVHCVIDKDGSIRDAHVVRSSFTPFNQSVLDAVRQWTFAPGTLRGEPVDTYFELTVRFQMR